MPAKKRVLPPPPQPSAPPPPPPQALTLPRFSAGQRLLVYPLCVLSPGAGFTLAALYMAQEEKAVRGFGWSCLAFAVIGAFLRAGQGPEFHAWEGADSLVQPFY